MAAQNSRAAAFSYNSQVTTGLVEISADSSLELFETHTITDISKTFLPGAVSHTASGRIYYDQGDVCVAAMEGDMATPPASPRAVVITFASGQGRSGNAFVTSFRPIASKGTEILAEFTLQFSGALTIV